MFERYNVWPVYADVAATLLAFLALMGMGVMFSPGNGGHRCTSTDSVFGRDNRDEVLRDFKQLGLLAPNLRRCRFEGDFKSDRAQQVLQSETFLPYLKFSQNDSTHPGTGPGTHGKDVGHAPDLVTFCSAFGNLLNHAADNLSGLLAEGKPPPQFVVTGYASGEWQQPARPPKPRMPKPEPKRPWVHESPACGVSNWRESDFVLLDVAAADHHLAMLGGMTMQKDGVSCDSAEYGPICECRAVADPTSRAECVAQRESYRMMCNRDLSYRRALTVLYKCELGWRQNKSAFSRIDDEETRNMIRVEGAGATDKSVRTGFDPDGQRRVIVSIRYPPLAGVP